MTPPESFSLPHGASGIEIGDLVIEFCKDKIVVLAKGRSEHYTLHLGNVSGILDIHRTWRDQDCAKHHQTVFAMHRVDIPAFLHELIPMTNGMLRLLRRLRLGWLSRHNIGIVKGLDPLSDDEIAGVTRRRSGRKRIVVDEGKLHDNIRTPAYLEEVWDFPDGAFSLFSGARRIGIGIKATYRHGRARLYWFRLRSASRFFNAMQEHMITAASKYAIPREKYSEHGVLEP